MDSDYRHRIGDLLPTPALSGLVRERHERQVDCKECGCYFAGLPEDVFCPLCASKHKALQTVRDYVEIVKKSEQGKNVRAEIVSEYRLNAIMRKEKILTEIRNANSAAFKIFVQAARARGIPSKDISRLVHAVIFELSTGWPGGKPRLGDKMFPMSWFVASEAKPCPICKIGKRCILHELCSACKKKHEALLSVRRTVVDAYKVLIDSHTEPSSNWIQNPRKAFDAYTVALVGESIGRKAITNARLTQQKIDLLHLKLSIVETRALGVPSKRIGEVVENALLDAPTRY